MCIQEMQTYILMYQYIKTTSIQLKTSTFLWQTNPMYLMALSAKRQLYLLKECHILIISRIQSTRVDMMAAMQCFQSLAEPARTVLVYE